MYPKIEFLYLDEEDMIQAGVKDMKKCIESMEEVLKCMALGDFVMGGDNHMSHGSQISFPKSSAFPNMPLDEGDDRRFMAMPAYIGGPFDLVGMKWYGSNMANKSLGLPRSILMVMLSDKTTGAPKALMSANLLSAMRTGAIPGVGAKNLAVKDVETIGICGPGVMGATSLNAFLTVYPNVREVKVKGRGKSSLENFINSMKALYPDVLFESVDSIKDLVENAEIVCFANSGGTDPSTYPYVERKWLKPGCLVVGLSAFDMSHEDLKKCRLVVDCKGLYEAWATEFPYPSFGPNNIIGSKFTDMAHDGIISMNQVDDLGDILLGKEQGRKCDDEIIIFSVGGMPVEDVAWGKICLDNAIEKNIGQKLKLWDKPNMH